MADPICPNCGTSNRPNAKYCANCRHALGSPIAQLSGAWQTQGQQTLALAWQQGIVELRALYDEWIARRPTVVGTLAGSPQPTTVNVVMQGLFGPVPFAGGSNTQPGLMLRVNVASGNLVDVLMIGATRGAMPQRGDAVSVWGQWDAGMNAYRAWRVTSSGRGELTTGRPAPLATLSLALVAFVVLTCVCSLFARVMGL